MADDLDEFLKQAAKRRQQRQQNKAERPPVVKPLSTQPPPKQSIPMAEVINEASRPIGNLTPTFSSAPPLSAGVDRADERMSAHLTHAFQHEIGKLRTEATRNEPKKTLQPSATSTEPTTSTNTVANHSSAILRLLRNPENLRTAIIAHEILKRPWQ